MTYVIFSCFPFEKKVLAKVSDYYKKRLQKRLRKMYSEGTFFYMLSDLTVKFCV